MKQQKIQLATVFSGIGAIEFAFKRLAIPYDLVFACDNGEREIKYNKAEEKKKVNSFKRISSKTNYIRKLYSSKTKKTNFVELSYLANYPEMTPQKYYEDIYLLNGKYYKGKVDLLMGGSPCQSFSTVGKQLGLEDTRGTLFYEFARLVKQIKPKVFIYENVRGLMTNNKGQTLETILRILGKEFKYNISYGLFNATEFNIPQNRRRLLIVGTLDDIGFNVNDIKRQELTREVRDFLEDNCIDGGFTSNGNGGLIISQEKGHPNEKAILSPLVTKYVLSGGTKNFYTKPVTDLPIARTLLKTMGNHHRAGVDNYITVDKDRNLYRVLTPRECLRLMGFTDDFKIVVPWGKAYMQIGNSIVVDMLIAVVRLLIERKAFD